MTYKLFQISVGSVFQFESEAGISNVTVERLDVFVDSDLSVDAHVTYNVEVLETGAVRNGIRGPKELGKQLCKLDAKQIVTPEVA